MLVFNSPDKFGYYKIGDVKTYSKIEALEKEIASNQKSTWHFNDEFFSNLNWKIEPNINLYDLYYYFLNHIIQILGQYQMEF